MGAAWSALLVLSGLAIGHGTSAAGQTSGPTTTVVCGSKTGERQTCAANTSGGVTLLKSLGTETCRCAYLVRMTMTGPQAVRRMLPIA